MKRLGKAGPSLQVLSCAPEPAAGWGWTDGVGHDV